MPEWLYVIIGIAGIASPVILAAMARDRTLLGMINAIASTTSERIGEAREETVSIIGAQIAPLHERINRVRDEYVRRDDLQGHIIRFERQFDEVKAEMRRYSESTDRKLDEIRNLLSDVRPMG